MREYIQRRAAYSMCLKRIYKRIGIDNDAARCVDYKDVYKRQLFAIVMASFSGIGDIS